MLGLRVIVLRVLGQHVLGPLCLGVVLFLFEMVLMTTNLKYKNCFIILVIIILSLRTSGHVTQSRLIVGYLLVGQPIGPIFKNQAAQEE